MKNTIGAIIMIALGVVAVTTLVTNGFTHTEFIPFFEMLEN